LAIGRKGGEKENGRGKTIRRQSIERGDEVPHIKGKKEKNGSGLIVAS